MGNTKPTTASIVAMIEPITASLFGAAGMGESLTALQFLGMGLILVTVTALSVHSNTLMSGPSAVSLLVRQAAHSAQA